MKKRHMRIAAAFALSAFLTAGCYLGMGQCMPLAWVRDTDHAAWDPRDSASGFVFQGKMWVLGGWKDSFELNPRDVWSSQDGTNWLLATANAAWKHGDFATTLVFKDRMWIMAGWYGGRLPGASSSSEVWSSTNGVDWDLATTNAGWSPRVGAGGAVFDGKMWILGGVESYYYGDVSSLRNDVWYSSDGTNWQLATAEAPWAPRAYHWVLAFNNRLWVFGGGNYITPTIGYNDVWCSDDGIHWKRVLAHAPWSPRIWFSSAVYKDQMWVLGGWSAHPAFPTNSTATNWPDIWFTADGVDWREFKTGGTEGFKVRHAATVFVLRDKMWIAGGMVPPLANDVWHIEILDSWLDSVVTLSWNSTSGAVYRIESTIKVNDPVWTSVSTSIIATSTNTTYCLTAPTNTPAFFRVVGLPGPVSPLLPIIITNAALGTRWSSASK